MRKIQTLTVFILLSFLLLSGCMPLSRLLNYRPSTKLKEVEFEEKEANNVYQFYYPDTSNNEYLRKLRVDYGLDTMVSRYDNEFSKIKKILDWTHKQWPHSGNNIPSESDPLTILEEAKKGNKFRCVEYGIVSSAALNSLGIPSRVIALKTADVEKVRYGAGHVAAECYSTEFKKWILIDGQFNAIPVLNNIPLNAVEFQRALSENANGLKMINLKGQMPKEEKEEYENWISKYLYYFDINFDNRYNPNKDKKRINRKHKLMLVPLNANEPDVFQRQKEINNCLYTHNINDFYRKPK